MRSFEEEAIKDIILLHKVKNFNLLRTDYTSGFRKKTRSVT